MRKTISWGSAGLIAVAAVLLTIICGLVIFNFIGAEKKIERRIERLYSLDNPRFRHELGALLGPPFVAGNLALSLQNGDEIFPAMLAAIRSAKTSITFETYRTYAKPLQRRSSALPYRRTVVGVMPS